MSTSATRASAVGTDAHASGHPGVPLTHVDRLFMSLATDMVPGQGGVADHGRVPDGQSKYNALLKAHLGAVKNTIQYQEDMENVHGIILWRRTFGRDNALYLDTSKAVESLLMMPTMDDAAPWVRSDDETVTILGKTYQRLRTDVRQYVVSVWPCMFYLGMIAVASIVLFGDGTVVRDKGTAMTLVFAYATLGWLLSNGMLFSPRYFRRPPKIRMSQGMPPPPLLNNVMSGLAFFVPGTDLHSRKRTL